MHHVRFVFALLLALGAAMTLRPAAAQVAVSISAPIPPPELPIYEQPPIPAPGYVWAPGYWAWGADGYYWVPATWVMPPAPVLLWTPAYWAWSDGAYIFVPGYWGPTVGFYGGIDYGYGYSGAGYDGGYWLNGVFFYNRAVNNFGGVHIGNVFNRPVVDRFHNRVSFNGGQGGTTLRPTPQQQAFAREGHVAMTPLQVQHEHAAAGNRALWNSVNHGHPTIAATARPGEFAGPGAAAAHHPPVPGHPGAPAAGLHVTAPAGPRPEPMRQFEPGRAPGEHPAAPYVREPGPVGNREAPGFHPTPGPHPGPEAHRGPQPHPGPGPREERRPPGQ